MGCIAPTPNGVRFCRICADSFFEKWEKRKKILFHVLQVFTAIMQLKHAHILVKFVHLRPRVEAAI
jgi:hypothetical protein